MFILTNINVMKDSVKVFDTTDKSNDIVKLSKVYKSMCKGTLSVRGISSKQLYQDDWYCEQFDFYVSRTDAKKAMAEYLVSRGTPIHEALARVGL